MMRLPQRPEDVDPLAVPPPDDGSVSPEEMMGNVDDSETAGLPEEEGPDTDAMLDELAQADKAGEQFAGESFFAPVPGAGEEAPGEAAAQPELTPEMLQALLSQLQGSGQ